MTDKERIDKAYATVKKKHPEVTAEDELKNLAIRQEKKSLLLQCGVWLLVGGLCALLLFPNWFGTDSSDHTVIIVLTFGTCLYEIVSNLLKIPKVERLFDPVVKVTNQGVLTADTILWAAGNKLKKYNNAFMLSEARLCDKEDELEVTINNFSYHKQYLYFDLGNNAAPQRFTVSAEVYESAAIGTLYILALTPDNEIFAVYQASNWAVAPDLQPYVRRLAPQQEGPQQ